jgi:hypothetical protein
MHGVTLARESADGSEAQSGYSESDGWMNHADFALQNVSTLREDASKGSDDELAALGLDWRLSAAVKILDQGEASLAKAGTHENALHQWHPHGSRNCSCGEPAVS